MSKIDFDIAERIDWTADVAPIAWPGDPEAAARTQLRALRKEELAIARGFYKGASWPYAVISLAGFATWLALFPLTILHLINPLAACLVATLIGIGGFITGHEGMHGNLRWNTSKSAGKSQTRRDLLLNEWVGWISLIPIVIPFTVARATHIAHHTHCNDPVRDPDYCDHAPNSWAALFKTWYNRQPGVQGVQYNYGRVLRAMGTPEAEAAQRHGLLYHLGFLAALSILAWTGHAIAAAMVWWLPRQLALSYIRFTFSWAPHHPRTQAKGRYGNTRVFRSRCGHLLSAGMQYHVIHHLYPNIMIHKNKAAFYALRPVLEARGVDCSALPQRD